MPTFITGHATHPDARMALALAAAQIEAQRETHRTARLAAGQPRLSASLSPTLGWIYLTDHFAPQADALLAELQQRWPGVHWVGNVGVGVMAGGVEYFDEPALVLMLCDLPPGSFQVFNGRQPLAAPTRPGRGFHSALVHADPATHDLEELIAELAGRTQSGYVFGGVTASRTRQVHIADGVFEGGLSGVAFAGELADELAEPAALGLRIVSRVTQGCQPLGPARRVTAAERNLVLTLDDQPALPLLLAELGVSLDQPQQAMAALRSTLVGLTQGDDAAMSRGGQFGADTRVRHLIGIDPARQGIAVAESLLLGQQLAFCRRDLVAARRDLVRICAEIRDELELEAPQPATLPDPHPLAQPAAKPLAPGRHASAARQATAEPSTPRIAGAIFVSCSGRGGPHFGAPSAEALIVQHALGDVPLVGFFAGGEIARHHLYGYTGVLTVFAAG